MRNKSYAVQVIDEANKAIVDNKLALIKNAKKLNSADLRKQVLHIIKMICPNGSIGDKWNSNQEFSLHCRMDALYCKPDVTFYYDNLDGFKDGRLLAVLDYLGCLDGARTPRSYEYAQSLNRTYNFDFGEFNIRVDATVRSDSPVCRKVIVSTELIKQDKYKIVCD